MIKLSVLCPRRPDLTLEQFKDHWRNVHGPLFSEQPEVRQHVRKYVQVHSTGKQLEGDFPGVSHYDGIAEIWFDRMEDIPKVFSSENFNTIIAADEAKFIDRERIKWIYATENVVIA
ncbi:EthD domain-containing protein [Mucilaginibacter sp. PAMB04274]|uniref:EthD domain-containing protein n=1 Tax=Mucilaginibacter sp. PAMB04274 TaxID=3138568 RepID=UPI0031F6B63D